MAGRETPGRDIPPFPDERRWDEIERIRDDIRFRDWQLDNYGDEGGPRIYHPNVPNMYRYIRIGGRNGRRVRVPTRLRDIRQFPRDRIDFTGPWTTYENRPRTLVSSRYRRVMGRFREARLRAAAGRRYYEGGREYSM